METLMSLPLSFSESRPLHIQQRAKRSASAGGGVMGILQSLKNSMRPGTIHIQHIAAGEQPVVDVCSEKRGSGHEIQHDTTSDEEEVVVSTSPTEPLHIYLRWPRDKSLQHLHIQSTDYSIKFEFEMPSIPSNATHLAPDDVDFKAARQLQVTTSSGGVSGLLPMEDRLEVSSTSGDVKIELLPLYADDTHQSALHIKSVSGSQSINGKIDAGGANARVHFPSRNCQMSLQSTSGTLRSVLGMTHSAAYESNSGSQHITALLSDHSRDRRSELKTSSTSGSQNITIVADPREDKQKAKGSADEEDAGFVCRHKANSGSMRIAYPDAWEGTFEASSSSGSVAVFGSGVETDKQQKRVTGAKGSAEHHTDVKTSSGSIYMQFGPMNS